MKTTILTCLSFAMMAGGCIPKDAAGASSQANADTMASCPPTAMIENAEDNNNQVMLQDNRTGYIYTYVDKAGSTISPNSDGAAFTMTPGGANGSKFAIRMTGKIGTADVVYAGIGVNFVDPKAPYDVSKYKGIAFWAKAAQPTKVRVKLPDKDTDPDGKVCSECYNDFGKEIDLTTAWQRYVITFDEMKQDSGWGAPTPPAIDKKSIYAVQFQVNQKGADYDVWVDDLGFAGCG